MINLSSFLAISKDKKVSVYDNNNKKKRVLISPDFDASEYVSVCISGLNEKLVATLNSNLQVILWQWDKQRTIASGDCATMPPQDKSMARMLQLSFSNCDPNHLLVTGKELFKFFKVDNNQLRVSVHSIAKKEHDISTTYTCHTWLPDGRIAVCTELGQIMLLESTGDYKSL